MRAGLAALTREQVNDAIRRHFSAEKLRVVIVAKDAEGLKQALLSDAPSTMTYESEKPAALLEEDRLIGARKLGLREDKLRILPIADVFAR
jgi:zinc protease